MLCVLRVLSVVIVAVVVVVAVAAVFGFAFAAAVFAAAAAVVVTAAVDVVVVVVVFAIVVFAAAVVAAVGGGGFCCCCCCCCCRCRYCCCCCLRRSRHCGFCACVCICGIIQGGPSSGRVRIGSIDNEHYSRGTRFLTAVEGWTVPRICSPVRPTPEPSPALVARVFCSLSPNFHFLLLRPTSSPSGLKWQRWRARYSSAQLRGFVLVVRLRFQNCFVPTQKMKIIKRKRQQHPHTHTN